MFKIKSLFPDSGPRYSVHRATFCKAIAFKIYKSSHWEAIDAAEPKKSEEELKEIRLIRLGKIENLAIAIEESCFEKVFATSELNKAIYFESVPSELFHRLYDTICGGVLFIFDDPTNIEFVLANIRSAKLDPRRFAFAPLEVLSKDYFNKMTIMNEAELASQFEEKVSKFHKCAKCKGPDGKPTPCKVRPIHTNAGDEASKILITCPQCNWTYKQR